MTICRILELPNIKFDKYLKEFDVSFENGQTINVNIIEYLCFITDPDPDNYLFCVEVNDQVVQFSEKINNFNILTQHLNIKKYQNEEIHI